MNLFKVDDKTDWFLLILIGFCAIAIDGIVLQVSLHVILPFVFTMVGIRNASKFFPNNSLKVYLFLVLWLGVCSIFACDPKVAITMMIKIISGFLCSFTLYHLALKEKNIVWVYLIVIASFVSMMVYANNNIGLIIAENIGDRLQNDIINANMFAYSLFYASFALYIILMKYVPNKLLVELTLVFGIIGISIWLSLMTASRQIIMLQIPLMVSLFAVKIFRLKPTNIMVVLLFICLLIFLGLPIFDNYYSGSLLAERSTVSFTEDFRSVVLSEAIRCGLDNPIFGVGPGNFVLINKYHVFSHNNFAELFSNGGFVAFILYVFMIATNLKSQWKRYRITSDRFFLYHFIFQLFFLIDNMLYVQISSLWLMGFYFISVGHSDSYYSRIYNRIHG